MENQSSDRRLGGDNLEEGEIVDSDKEDKSGWKARYGPQRRGNSDEAQPLEKERKLGQMWALQCVPGGLLKRKNSDVGGSDMDDGSPMHQQKKARQYLDFDHVQDEDDWTHNVTFAANKRRYGDDIDDFNGKMAPFKRNGGLSRASEGGPNADSAAGNSRSKSQSSVKRKKKFEKLGALCHIKGKKKKRKRKPGVNRKLKVEEPDDRPTCKYYLEGNCAKGKDCQFYHPPRQVKKKEPCKFYSTGHCTKRKQCHFMHEEFPCKFFHTGAECYSKENCKFSHKPLTEETRMLLHQYLSGPPKKDGSPRKPEPPEPKVKRGSILGTPPKCVKESLETRMWQEEMKKNEKQMKNGSAFKIQVKSPSPVREVKSPSKFTRPSFYVDTLLRSPSPKKRSPLGEISGSVSPPKSSSVSEQPPFTAEENGSSTSAIFSTALVKKVKNYFAESEGIEPVKESEMVSSPKHDDEKLGIPKEETSEETPKSYLPCTEKMYFSEERVGCSVIRDTPKVEFIKTEIEVDQPAIKDEYCYSSGEDEDEVDDDNEYNSEEDDTDQSLTDELFDMPCTKDEDKSPAMAPPFDLLKTIKLERQKANEKSQTSAYHETNAYWENVMSSSTASSSSPSSSATTYAVFQDPFSEQLKPQSPRDCGNSKVCHDIRKDVQKPKAFIPNSPQLQNGNQRKPPCPKDEDKSPAAAPPFDILKMIKLERQKANEKSQSSACHETNAYWENIMSSPAPSSPSSSATTFAVCQDPFSEQVKPRSPRDSGSSKVCHDIRKDIQEPKTFTLNCHQLQNGNQKKPACPKYVVKAPAAVAPPFDLLKMIKLERQKANQKSQSSAYDETKVYGENAMPSSTPSSPSSSATTSAVCQDPFSEQVKPLSSRVSENSQVCHDIREDTQELKPFIPNSPQLRNGDQRNPVNEFLYFPPPPFSFKDKAKTLSPLIGAEIGNQCNELGYISRSSQNPTPAVVRLHEEEGSVTSPHYLSRIREGNYDPHLDKHAARNSNAVEQSTCVAAPLNIPPLMSADSLNCDTSHSVPNGDYLAGKVSFTSESLKFEDAKTFLPEDVDSSMHEPDTAGSLPDVTTPSAAHVSEPQVVPSGLPRRSAPYLPGQLCSSYADPRFTNLFRAGSMVKRKVSTVLPPKNIAVKKELTQP